MRSRLRMFKSLLREAWQQKGIPTLYFAQIRFLRWGVILDPEEALYLEEGGKASELSIDCIGLVERQEPSIAVIRLLEDLFQIGPRLSRNDRTRVIWRREFQTVHRETIAFPDDRTVVVGPHFRLTRVPEKDYKTRGPFWLPTHVSVFDAVVTRDLPKSVGFEDDEASDVTRMVCETSQSGRIKLVVKRKEE